MGIGRVGLVMKRATDILVASLALLILAPILLITALFVLLEDGRPVLFRQERSGLRGQPFTLYKLRTMRRHDTAPTHVGQVTLAHPLVTRVGRFARRTNIDEIPQLLNVLLGDMSLVGPRPTLPEQVAVYSPFERRRLDARPGMTGWAQVNGSTELTWPERILLDVWWIDHWSFLRDVRIMLSTVRVIVTGHRAHGWAVREAAEHAKRTYGHG